MEIAYEQKNDEEWLVFDIRDDGRIGKRSSNPYAKVVTPVTTTTPSYLNFPTKTTTTTRDIISPSYIYTPSIAGDTDKSFQEEGMELGVQTRAAVFIDKPPKYLSALRDSF